ncbi:MAG: diphthine synthase, partial [Candidatus Aenigmatarchaeota archaeon]
SEKYDITSFFDGIIENKKNGLHTLVLLDRNMGTKEGLEIIKKIEEKRKKNLIKEVIICSMLGSKNEKIFYGKIDEMILKDLPPPAVIIIPGELHFLEKEILENLK